MNNRQCTLLADTRPSRVAFLVDLGVFTPDSPRFQALLIAITDLNKKQWGGRTHHVEFYIGESLTEDQWLLLEWADPDYVIGCSMLPAALVQSLDNRLQPCGIEIQNQAELEPERISLHNNWSVGVPPTRENLARLSEKPGHLISDPAQLLVVGFGENCSADIKRFVHLNFGTYDQWLDPKTKHVRRNVQIERVLTETNALRLTVTDLGSLAEILTTVSGTMDPRDAKRPISFFAPYQLSSIQLPDWPWREFQHKYQLIVGDSPKDFSEHWNGARWKGNWTATHERQLWIPSSFLADKAFAAAVRHWINRLRSWDSSWCLECISHSVPEAQITAFLNLVNNPRHFPTNVISSSAADARREELSVEHAKRKRFIAWQTNGDVPRQSVSFAGDIVNLPMPAVMPEQGSSARWMVDIQLEHLSNHRNSGPDQAWWHLPKERSRWVTRSLFGKPARINASGRISVEIENIDALYARRVRPQLAVNPLSDYDVVRLITCPSVIPLFAEDDPRSELTPENPIVARCHVSDKGRYLAAVLGQFKNFWTAANFCERRFWRTLFSDLAGHKAGDDEGLRERVIELLTPHLAPADMAEQVKLAKELAGKFLHLVRGRLQGQRMTFAQCQGLRKRFQREPAATPLVYPQGIVTVHRHDTPPLTAEDMQGGLDLLLESGILRLGIYKDCPRCTVGFWHHVNDLNQEVLCPGCGHAFTLGTREAWSYSLNSLARMSVSQGVLGVLHALTAAASHARYFFAFAPSLDLFKSGEKKPWHEIDVAYVIDGEFVLGGVKEGFVQEKDFAELVEIALAVRPNRAVIFLPLENLKKQKDEIQKWVAQYGGQLQSSGISLEIFALPGI